VKRAVVLLAAVLVVRLAFGLCGELFGPDESQIYLIGLQFFTTGAWPFYGPDVVYTRTQIPGALQGLLAGGPLFVWHAPEAPYVLLNLLSLGSLVALGWYIRRRLPEVPGWMLWPWIFFAPWTLEMSTHVINQSYLLPGAVAFFIGMFEAAPFLRRGILGRRPAWFLMGFGLLWVYQLQLSYALLVPIAAVTWIAAARTNLRQAFTDAALFAAGALTSGTLVIPTILRDGLHGVAGSTSTNVVFSPGNLLQLPQIAARFLSFASFEIARFLGADTPARLRFLSDYPWAAPFVVVAALAGVVQALSLGIGLFRARHPRSDWPAVRWTTIGVVLLMYASFAVSIKDPASHTIYLTMPLAMIYAFTCWAPMLQRRSVQAFVAVLFLCGAVTHVAVAIRDFHLRSLYTNRSIVAEAIDERDYRIMGERRPEIWKKEAGGQR